MEKKIGVLFDLDGTLLNTLEDLADAVNYTLHHFGCPERSLEEVRTFVGNGVRNLLTRALPGREDDPDFEEVLQVYTDYYGVHSQDKTKPYDGILAALAKVSAKYPVAIVSNKHDSAVKSLCADFFPGYYALGETPGCPRKPNPDMVYKVMQDIGVEKCVFVGDSEVDVLTAKNAGVPCISVLWGFRDKGMLAEHGAEHFCDDTAKLFDCIREVAND